MSQKKERMKGRKKYAQETFNVERKREREKERKREREKERKKDRTKKINMLTKEITDLFINILYIDRVPYFCEFFIVH